MWKLRSLVPVKIRKFQKFFCLYPSLCLHFNSLVFIFWLGKFSFDEINTIMASVSLFLTHKMLLSSHLKLSSTQFIHWNFPIFLFSLKKTKWKSHSPNFLVHEHEHDSCKIDDNGISNFQLFFFSHFLPICF
jgi:hypothetical protein